MTGAPAARPRAQRFLGTPATAPGPLGPEMLRELTAIRTDPLDYLVRAWRTHGDVVQFPIPRPPSYLVNEPESVWRVLVMTDRGYTKETIQYRSLSLVTGDGLLAVDTPGWRRQRPLVQPAFHHEGLGRIVEHVNGATARLTGEWAALPDGAVVDMDAAMMELALEVVGHALFGTDLSADASAITAATLSALDVVVARARVPLTPPSWLPTPGNRTLARSVATLDGAVRHMLSERARCPRDQPEDMLDMLIASRDDQGSRLTPAELRDQVVTFIVAGHETVASALTWAWALLAADERVQARLHEEADAVLGDRDPEFADYRRLPFARAVFDEVLRLYPPAWLITRKAVVPDTLAGHEIPAGALVILSPWLLHRHPAIWSDPEAFLPERFLAEDVPRRAFLPFGAGLRQCIGRDFAYVEGVLTLAALARRVSVSYPAGMGVPAVRPLVTVRPEGGLSLRVTAR
ncbi:MAG: cytochrome P450 [Actinomycetales bacterium]|nr:cytochrome P450 [Actinomycetales bacterium]